MARLGVVGLAGVAVVAVCGLWILATTASLWSGSENTIFRSQWKDVNSLSSTEIMCHCNGSRHAPTNSAQQSATPALLDSAHFDEALKTVKQFMGDAKWDSVTEEVLRYYADYGTSCWADPPTGHPKATQKVISLSFYLIDRTKAKHFVDELELRVAEAQELYPEFTFRVYTDEADPAGPLCRVYCQNSDRMDLCLMDKSPLTRLLRGNKMMWRFLVMGDPSVEMALVRDVDNIYIRRERDAVDEWAKVYLPQGRSFHGMRDNPVHQVPMLGGMWDVANYLHNDTGSGFLWKNLALSIRLNSAKKGWNTTMKGMDQVALASDLFANVKDELVSHSSWFCKEFGDLSVPFPTRRDKSGEFVGGYRDFAIKAQCPAACRPKDHQDWEFC